MCQLWALWSFWLRWTDRLLSWAETLPQEPGWNNQRKDWVYERYRVKQSTDFLTRPFIWITLMRSTASWAWAMRALVEGFLSDLIWVEPRYLAPNTTPSSRSSVSQGPGTEKPISTWLRPNFNNSQFGRKGMMKSSWSDSPSLYDGRSVACNNSKWK